MNTQNPKATVSVCRNLTSELSVSIRSLPKDAGVFDQHYTPDDLHLILKGSIKAVHTGSNGTTSVIANFGAGEFFGAKDDRLALASVITLEPCRLLSVSGDYQNITGLPKTSLFAEIQQLARDYSEVQQQKTAISDILKAIARSPTDVQYLLEAVSEHAARLCDTTDAVIMQVAGDELLLVAKYGLTPIWPVGTKVPISRNVITGRSIIERAPIHVHDLQMAESEFPDGAATAKKFGTRTAFATPLICGDRAIGAIFVRRFEVRPLTDRQIELLVAFADQAAIVIENVRLFNEIQEKSQRLKDQAKELADWNAALETRVAEQVGQIKRLSKLEHELELAGEIQISMMPSSVPDLEGYQFGAKMLPAKYVGGDFYDFIPFGGSSLGIAVGDVSDKGLAAALFMAMVRSLLRAEAHPDQSPKEVLARVNQHLLDMNDKDMFVTLVYGILNRHSQEFLYARAGHEAPILRDGFGAITHLPWSHGRALGIFDDLALEERRIALPKGSMMLLYSDGISDATNAKGERFGTERLSRILMNAKNKSAHTICNYLLDTVREYQGNSPQNDDMAAVVVQAV